MEKLKNDDFNQLNEWLKENLTCKNCFVPHLDKIPEINSKGIYFWFMKPEGYEKLSKYIAIKPIEPKYTINCEGVIYDLVYLGTAGTSKKGNSNLFKRFEWHIKEHSESSICSGHISTLRSGLGSLLSDDLILPNTENEINQFMKEFMKLCWIEYPNDKKLIDTDERFLIKGLKPLLNIKNNPNALAASKDNPTKHYKKRRVEIVAKSKSKLNCKKETKTIKKTKNPDDNTPLFAENILTTLENGCVEYFVLQGQDIGEVTRGIEGLPTGKCKITIYDSKNIEFEFTEWDRITGSKKQNIYTYFDNSSTFKDENNKYLSRKKVVKKWMKENKIEEITIKVCAIN
jgi:hypothetical protein